MLSSEKLKEISLQRQIDIEQLAKSLVKTGRNHKQAIAAVKNWQKGLFRPKPTMDDIRRLSGALSVEANNISDWRCSYKYAPISPRKAQLVAKLISGRSVQEAMDILKFTEKRAAEMIDKVLRSAVANATEQQADEDNLYVCCTRIDDAGIRIGTKRWIAKDRGRAHPLRKKACHIYVSVAQI
jgi:large subunit ribosomal protein L22